MESPDGRVRVVLIEAAGPVYKDTDRRYPWVLPTVRVLADGQRIDHPEIFARKREAIARATELPTTETHLGPTYAVLDKAGRLTSWVSYPYGEP